jgi:hypothetical protein
MAARRSGASETKRAGAAASGVTDDGAFEWRFPGVMPHRLF